MESSLTSPYVSAGVAVLGGLIFGYNTGIIASASADFLSYFSETDNNVVSGLITSTILAGAMLGSFSGAFILSNLGRKLTSYIACILCFHGAVTAAMSPDYITFLVLRFVLGIGVGLVSVFCPYYVSETAPPDKKGMFGVLFQLSLTFAIFIANLVGWAILTYVTDNNVNWRIMIGIGGIFPLMLALLTFTSVEDPVIGLQDELRPISSTTPELSEGTWGQLFGANNVLAVMTGTMLAATLQLTGINAIMFYGPKIFAQVTKGGDTAFKINIGLTFWNFFATVIAVVLVERAGRRLLLLIGTAIMTVSLIVAGVCCIDSVTAPESPDRAIGVGIALFSFIGGFEVGIGCLFWVLINEVFPSHVRDKGGVYCNVLQWGFNLGISYTFPLLIAWNVYATFFIYGGVGVLCFIYLALFLRLEPPAPRVIMRLE